MKQLWMFLLVGLLLSTSCMATDAMSQQSQLAETDELYDALPDAASELLPESTPTAPGDFNEGLTSIGRSAAAAARQWLPEALRTMGLLLMVVLLCGLVSSVGSGSAKMILIVGVLALAGICTHGLESVFSIGRQTIDELQVFSAALMTTLTATAASTGAVTTAATLHAGTVFFLNLLLRLVTELLLPLVYGYLAAGAMATALGHETLRRVADLMKWVVTLCLKIVTTVFIAYLTISGVIGGSADGTAVKAMKLAISTAVPVVGSIISDASETVLVSAGLLKNAVGVFGILGLLAICAVPFARIGLQYLSLKLAAALAAVVDSVGLIKLLDILATAMGMVLAMTAVSALMTLFSCICVLRMVTPS